MKKYYPSYYDMFSCIAGECSDTCCAKWQIVIDDETYLKYTSLQGSLSDKIREHIITDCDNERCFRLVNSRCPFLDKENLCEIHKIYGEEYTSSVCRLHPRFTEEYDGFTEISLSLSCPEVNRILFDDKTVDDYIKPEYSGEDEVLDLLISSRDKLLREPSSFADFYELLMNTSADDQLDIDLVYVDTLFEYNEDDIRAYISFLSENCEILTENWKNILSEAMNADKDYNLFDRFIIENEKNILKALRYFLYRYYLKAVNDLDIYSRAIFILMSVVTSAYLAFIREISFKEAIRLYSKEIEHNLENTEKIIEYFSNF